MFVSGKYLFHFKWHNNITVSIYDFERHSALCQYCLEMNLNYTSFEIYYVLSKENFKWSLDLFCCGLLPCLLLRYCMLLCVKFNASVCLIGSCSLYLYFNVKRQVYIWWMGRFFAGLLLVIPFTNVISVVQSIADVQVHIILL